MSVQNWWAATIQPGHSCDLAKHDDHVCKDALSKAALIQSIVGSVTASISFFVAPLIGRLSDTYGRKPVMVISATMSVMHPVSLVLNDKYGLSFYFYYAANVLLVLAPGLIGALTYIADVTAVRFIPLACLVASTFCSKHV